MIIKQDTRARFTARRDGSKRHFLSRPQYYAAGYGWRRYPNGTVVRLQRLASDGSWLTIERKKVYKGEVRFAVSPKKVNTYRVAATGTKRSWPMRCVSIRL